MGVSAVEKHRPNLGLEDKQAFDSSLKLEYWSFVMDADGTNAKSWAGDLNQELLPFLGDQENSSSLCAQMKCYKLGLVQDDDALENRLRVLSWLVSELGFRVNLVNVMRWRQVRYFGVF